MNPLFVGEAPGPNGDPGCPLYPMPPNSAGSKLYRMTGIKGMRSYLRQVDRIDLLPEYPGKTWPKKRAKAAADMLRASGLLRARRIVLIGRNVLRSFYGSDVLTECVLGYSGRGQCMIGWIPHPSGLNRWYNDPENERRVREFLDYVLNEPQEESQYDCL